VQRQGLKSKTPSVPLADDFAALVAELSPRGFVWPTALRTKFDMLYRELSRIDEERLKE
jgi:hypothetical protein